MGVAATIAPDPPDGLFTKNASAPLEQQLGLRHEYKFGLYGHCAYVNDTAGLCSNTSAANRFEPFNAIVGDMLPNFTSISTVLLSNYTISDSAYLGNFSNGAYYLLLIGSICAALALITSVLPRSCRAFHFRAETLLNCSGVLKHALGFLASAVLGVIGSLMLLISCTIWTVLIKKTQSINSALAGPAAAPVPLGIDVSIGNGLYLAWGAFACLTISLVPYMIMWVIIALRSWQVWY